jgi:hypothetical protein
MKLKTAPNRTTSERKKSTKNKKSANKLKSFDKTPIKEAETVPTKFHYDDEFDNWFPWETH